MDKIENQTGNYFVYPKESNVPRYGPTIWGLLDKYDTLIARSDSNPSDCLVQINNVSRNKKLEEHYIAWKNQEEEKHNRLGDYSQRLI